MYTLPGAAVGPLLIQRQIIPRAHLSMGQRLWRALSLVLAGALLAGCSATRLAYNQAPTFSYWWLDRQVNLTDAQSEQVREDLGHFFDWHRRIELPAYIGLLQRWQLLARADLSAAQTCAEFELVRERLDAATERSHEPLARLALQLSPDQVQALQRHQAKTNKEYEDEFVRGSPDERLQKRLGKAVDRSEDLYGSLTPAQHELLQQQLQASPYDAPRSHRERQRRQDDLRQTIRAAQAAVSNPLATARPGTGLIRSAQASQQPAAAALPLLRAYSQRIWQSPTPGYRAYSAALVLSGCAQFAALHNSTSVEQRQHAVGVLKGYEDDLRALAGEKSPQRP